MRAWLAGAALSLLVAGGLAPGALPAWAEALHRYSGRVTDIDLGRGVVVVEELGRRGRSIRHEVQVEAETPLVAASRLRPADMRSSAAYGEIAVSLADVIVGDFVVVEEVDLEGHRVVRRITIVETRRTQ
jgi:hypothetical protein